MKNMTQSIPLHSFQRTQFQLAAHIRNPETNPAPEGIEDRRLEIYRRLFFNNIESFIASGFPALKSIVSPDYWTAMVRDFVHRHQSHSPYFLEIGSEFLRYLQAERIPRPQDQPFLLELAHYEWVELALDVSPLEFPAVAADGDLLADCPVVSPLAWSFSYQFPVHKIGPDFQPRQPEVTHLVVYRNRQMQVGFMEINLVTQRLLEILAPDSHKDNGPNGKEALLQLAAESHYSNPEALLEFGADLLKRLQDKHIICGFK